MKNKPPLEEGKVIALRSNLPPHFNKDKVLQALTAPLPGSVPVLGRYKEAVRCKTVGKSVRHMMLHMQVDAQGVSFKISSPQDGWGKGWHQPVTREAIMKGITEAGNGTWATVTLGSMIIHLERNGLLAALHKLEGKLQKQQTG